MTATDGPSGPLDWGAVPYVADALIDANRTGGEADFMSLNIGEPLSVMRSLWLAFKKSGRAGLVKALFLLVREGAGAHLQDPQPEDPLLNPPLANSPYESRSFSFLLYRPPASSILTAERRPDRLAFQVNPETITLTYVRSSGTYDVVSAFQKMQIGQLGLRVLSFSTFFPARYDYDYCGLFPFLDKTPGESFRWLTGTMNDDQPVVFGAVGDCAFPTMNVFVTNFTPHYQQGHPDDIFFDLELTEARQPILHKVGKSSAGSSGTLTPKDKKHLTKRGETLSDVAVKEYGKGHGSHWQEIYNANKTAIKKLISEKKWFENPKKDSLPSSPITGGHTLSIPTITGKR